MSGETNIARFTTAITLLSVLLCSSLICDLMFDTRG
jgi:hypothetical protein